jgi:hypothetical protein
MKGTGTWLARIAACGGLLWGCTEGLTDIPDNTSGFGSLEITVSTVGTNPDPDGYTITLDESLSEAVPPNGTVSFNPVRAASYRVVISGVAANCSVQGGTTRFVSVPRGGQAYEAFLVECV